MKKLILLSITFIFMLINGCATAYQSQRFGQGYSETQLDENVFIVNFKGNGFTDKQRSEDMCLLRSAELCKKAGYNYFIIVEASSDVKHTQYKTAEKTTTTGSARVNANTTTRGNATVTGNNVTGSSTSTTTGNIYGSSTSTTTGGQTYNFALPSNKNKILCTIDKPEEESYNADFIINSIGGKYNISINQNVEGQSCREITDKDTCKAAGCGWHIERAWKCRDKLPTALRMTWGILKVGLIPYGGYWLW